MLFLVTTQLEYLYLGFSNICNFNKKEIVHFYVHLNGVSDPDSNQVLLFFDYIYFYFSCFFTYYGFYCIFTYRNIINSVFYQWYFKYTYVVL